MRGGHAVAVKDEAAHVGVAHTHQSQRAAADVARSGGRIDVIDPGERLRGGDRGKGSDVHPGKAAEQGASVGGEAKGAASVVGDEVGDTVGVGGKDAGSHDPVVDHGSVRHSEDRGGGEKFAVCANRLPEATIGAL